MTGCFPVEDAVTGPVPGLAGAMHRRRREATSALLVFRSTESGLSGGSVRAQRQMRKFVDGYIASASGSPCGAHRATPRGPLDQHSPFVTQIGHVTFRCALHRYSQVATTGRQLAHFVDYTRGSVPGPGQEVARSLSRPTLPPRGTRQGSRCMNAQA